MSGKKWYAQALDLLSKTKISPRSLSACEASQWLASWHWHHDMTVALAFGVSSFALVKLIKVYCCYSTLGCCILAHWHCGSSSNVQRLTSEQAFSQYRIMQVEKVFLCISESIQLITWRALSRAHTSAKIKQSLSIITEQTSSKTFPVLRV